MKYIWFAAGFITTTLLGVWALTSISPKPPRITDDQFTLGYDAAVDSCLNRSDRSGVGMLLESLDSYGLNYVVLVRRGDSTVAKLHVRSQSDSAGGVERYLGWEVVEQ